jgi:CheY-like chemotaxis protein
LAGALSAGTLESKSNEGACRMESLAVDPEVGRPDDEPIELLIADDDALLRSFVAARARDVVSALAVYEAADGAEAIQIGLQRRPQIALLDVDMPRLGGIEVALVLRELLPGLRIALHTGDPSGQSDTAREFCLPLFDKLESEHALRWLARQARNRPLRPPHRIGSEKLALECSVCGYGITRSTPPERCPMCQSEGAWNHAARWPLTTSLHAT